MEAGLVPQPLREFIRLCFQKGGSGRLVQQQLPSATLYFSAHAKKGADHKINKQYLSQEWRGQSNHIIIHAVHANRALLPSKP